MKSKGNLKEGLSSRSSITGESHEHKSSGPNQKPNAVPGKPKKGGKGKFPLC